MLVELCKGKVLGFLTFSGSLSVEPFLHGLILFVFLALICIVSHVCTPMFFTEDSMFLSSCFLWDAVSSLQHTLAFTGLLISWGLSICLSEWSFLTVHCTAMSLFQSHEKFADIFGHFLVAQVVLAL